MNADELALIRNYCESFETDRMITFLDLANNNIYSSVKYAQLYGLTPEDLLGKNLVEFTKNKYAMSMVNSIGKYSRLMQASKPKYVSGILKCNTFIGAKIFLFEVRNIKSLYYRVELQELQISLMKDILHVINQIDGTKKYQKKVISPNEFRVSGEFKFINELRVPEYFKLNEEEEIVVFLLSIGKSYKEISNILSKLYSREINNLQIKRMVHNNLMVKFDILNISDLITLYLMSSPTHPIPEKLILLLELDGILAISYN